MTVTPFHSLYLTKRSLFMPLALAAFLCVSAVSQAFAESKPETAVISVSAEGEVKVRPDIAILSTAVVTEAKSAREALSENNKRTAAVIQSFKDAAIEAKDISTAGFSLSPKYSYPSSLSSAAANKTPQIEGYSVRNGIVVTVRDFEKAGALLDKAIASGSNDVSGLLFTFSEREKHLQEARAAAMRQAMSKADVILKEAGAKRGRIISIHEAGGSAPMAKQMMMRASAMSANDAAVPIEAGEQAVRVTLNVTWEVVQ